jgi:hypothetical protein
VGLWAHRSPSSGRARPSSSSGGHGQAKTPDATGLSTVREWSWTPPWPRPSPSTSMPTTPRTTVRHSTRSTPSTPSSSRPSNRFAHPRPRATAVRQRPRRGARQGLQPAVHLRRLRAGQDPPAARHRPLRPQPLPQCEGALRELRGVHQRLHQQHPRRQGGRLPTPLPRCRRAAHRRHPVPPGQGADAGGVLPHLQRAAQRQQAGRHHQSDVPPKQLAGFEERLRSRFEWGLLTDVQPPTSRPGSPSCARRPSRSASRAGRGARVHRRRRISTNIRELEGALIRVTAFASLNRQPVDLALAEIVLKDLIPTEGPPRSRARRSWRRPRLLRAHGRRPVRVVPFRALVTRARSPCTCAASSPTCPCPRSARPSAAATTRRSCTPTEDPPADGRAAGDLQPGHRAHQPDQARRGDSISRILSTIACGWLWTTRWLRWTTGDLAMDAL